MSFSTKQLKAKKSTVTELVTNTDLSRKDAKKELSKALGIFIGPSGVYRDKKYKHVWWNPVDFAALKVIRETARAENAGKAVKSLYERMKSDYKASPQHSIDEVSEDEVDYIDQFRPFLQFLFEHTKLTRYKQRLLKRLGQMQEDQILLYMEFLHTACSLAALKEQEAPIDVMDDWRSALVSQALHYTLEYAPQETKQVAAGRLNVIYQDIAAYANEMIEQSATETDTESESDISDEEDLEDLEEPEPDSKPSKSDRPNELPVEDENAEDYEAEEETEESEEETEEFDESQLDQGETVETSDEELDEETWVTE